MTGVTVTEQNGHVDKLETGHMVLAIGHSARDTYEMLYGMGLFLEQKPFSIGARMEHPQRSRSTRSVWRICGMPILRSGGIPAGYPFGKWPRGIHLRMCPGGSVVAAASEEGMTVTNGMSNFARDGINANAALLVGIGPKDFGGDHPLSGMYLQRKLEQAAFQLAGGSYLVRLRGWKISCKIYLPLDGRCGAYLWARDRSQQFIGLFARLCGGIHAPGNFGHGSEAAWICLSRCGFDWGGNPQFCTSTVAARRKFQSVSLAGLYPCGEGAGYAGGIVSAAVDGIKCAEQILLSSSL